MLLNFDSVSLGSNSYEANKEIKLLEELSENRTNLVKGLTALNADPNSPVTVTIKLGNSILVSQTLQPREYITFNTWIVVNNVNALKVISDSTNVDFTIPMIIKANKVEL